MTSTRPTREESRVIIDLPIDWESTENWKIVKAEIVDVAPHLANIMTFAVHRDPSLSMWWQVSNVETGKSCFRIPTAGRWKQRTIDAVRERLSKITVQKATAALSRHERKSSSRGS